MHVGQLGRTSLITCSACGPAGPQSFHHFLSMVAGGRVVAELAFVHYFDTPEANYWRAKNGNKPQSMNSKKLQDDIAKKRCPVVEPYFVYDNQRVQKPWVGVVLAAHVRRLVSFAPCYMKHASPQAHGRFYVLNKLLEPSAIAMVGLQAVAQQFGL